MRRSSKVALFVVALAALTTWTNAVAAIKEPTALVAADLSLTAQQPYVQGACPGPNFYDALYIHLVGTETDRSDPPHPELTGTWEGNVVTYLEATGTSTATAGTVKATLTDDAGQTLYEGMGEFAGTINGSGNVVGRGIFRAALYEGGVRTQKILLANFTLEQSLFNYNITGQLGQASNVPTFAIETAGVCPTSGEGRG
jgi:hypothetical protein